MKSKHSSKIPKIPATETEEYFEEEIKQECRDDKKADPMKQEYFILRQTSNIQILNLLYYPHTQTMASTSSVLCPLVCWCTK